MTPEEIARSLAAPTGSDAAHLLTMFREAAVPFEVYRGPGDTLLVTVPEVAIFMFAADGHFVSLERIAL